MNQVVIAAISGAIDSFRISGVATGWYMSTTLLPEAIPEIDANPTTFLGASGEGVKCKRVGEVIRLARVNC